MKSLVFDTETTDLIDNIGRPLIKQPYIIEFFGVTVDHGLLEMTDYLGTLIKPPINITEKTTQITGITKGMLEPEQPFSIHADRIKAFIEGHDRVVAHNARYDVDMVDIEFKRLGLRVDWPEIFCTVEATEHLQGYRLKLDDLHIELIGESFSDHHRAEPDTRATGRIYIEMLKRGMA